MSLVDNFRALQVTKRPISAHFIHYHQDGTGRDSYIKTCNGGLYSKDLIQKNQPKQREQSSHIQVFNNSTTVAPSYKPRFVHYMSDGSGRDSYVCRNDGGYTTPYHWRGHYEHKFRSSLRDWSVQSKRDESPFDRSKLNHIIYSESSDSYVSKFKRQNSFTKRLQQAKPLSQQKYDKAAFHPNLLNPQDVYLSYNVYPFNLKKKSLKK